MTDEQKQSMRFAVYILTLFVISEGITYTGDRIQDGKKCSGPVSVVGCYHALWDSLNAKRGYGWDKNPWVYVVTFKII